MLNLELEILFFSQEGISSFKIKFGATAVSQNTTPVKLMLSADGFIDVVYSKSFIKSSGICQSILLGVLSDVLDGNKLANAKGKQFHPIYQNLEFQNWKQERSEDIKKGHSTELPRITLLSEEDSESKTEQTGFYRKQESDKNVGTPAVKSQIKAFFPSLLTVPAKKAVSNPQAQANDGYAKLLKTYKEFKPRNIARSNFVQQTPSFIQPVAYPQQFAPVYVPVLIQPMPQIRPYQAVNPGSEVSNSSEPLLTGKLKFFDESQNYGFFVVDCNGSDLFVHYDELLRAGLTKELIRVAKITGITFSFRCIKYYGKYDLSQKAVDVRMIQDLNLGYMMQSY
jgi:hypothetical protein